MSQRVVLCIDSHTLQVPEIIGLHDENIMNQEWLTVFSTSSQTRHFLKNTSSVQEVWIISCDDMEPINMAAGLKKDNSQRKVFLVSFQETGSLKSRAHAACLDGVLTQSGFLQHYEFYKKESLFPSSTDKHASEHEPTVQVYRPEQKKKEELREKNQLAQARQARAIVSPNQAGTKAAHVIAIVSASGGSGKSSVSAITTLLCQKAGLKTLLLDADLQFGDIHHMVGVKEPLTVDQLLHDRSLFQGLTSPNPSEFVLIAAPRRLEQYEQVIEVYPQLIAYFKSYFDVIIINTGAFWCDQHVEILDHASCSLFLVDQRMSSIRATKHALSLCSRCGIATQQFRFAINRCTRNSLFSSIDVSCALSGASVLELNDGGKEVDDLLNLGQAKELIDSKNPFVESIEMALSSSLVTDSLQKKMSGSVQPLAERNKKFSLLKRKRRVACL